eukprot:gene15563-biopygen11800
MCAITDGRRVETRINRFRGLVHGGPAERIVSGDSPTLLLLLLRRRRRCRVSSIATAARLRCGALGAARCAQRTTRRRRAHAPRQRAAVAA